MQQESEYICSVLKARASMEIGGGDGAGIRSSRA